MDGKIRIAEDFMNANVEASYVDVTYQEEAEFIILQYQFAANPQVFNNFYDV
uniref:Uncharacterized protein n=1 Tax=Tetranychus urticae TaxID=32264 RepID=T1JT39_TETUR